MKIISSMAFLVLAVLSLHSVAETYQKSPNNLLDVDGVVARFLTTVHGDVDGFILKNGTQVSFPPTISEKIATVVAVGDAVDVKGFRENAKVLRAEVITNKKTNKSAIDIPPDQVVETGPSTTVSRKGEYVDHEDLDKITASGTIKLQLFGPRGNINGVILSDETIVFLDSRVVDDSKAKIDVGQNLKVSGYGTKNNFGKSMNAVEMSNQ